MKKFLIGLVAGIILAGLALLVFVFSLMRFGERKPVVADGSILVLQLSGEIPEQPPLEIPLPMFEAAAPLTMVEVWDVLRKAAADSRIKAVVLEPGGLAVGWGKLQEIREGLLKYKKSGKPLVAFLRNPGMRQYYLATAADRIYVTGEDILDVKGLRAELMFVRRTLDKLGVQFEVEHAGKYKDAADMFTRTSMTPETREVMNSILDHLQGHLVETIAAARKQKPEQVKATFDEGPLLAEQAKAKGLVDGMMFHDEVYEELRKQLGLAEVRKVSLRDYNKIPASSLGLEGGPRIAVLVGEGMILRGSGDGPGGDEGVMVSGPFNKLVRQVAADAGIRGVVLRVDSPGGDAIASDEILHELKLLSRKKPLVVSMSDTAASGGYYIAMTGDPVVAYPSTLTGSIGVIYGKLNLRGLYEKLGVQKEIITRGRFADIDSDYQPLSETGRKKLREGIDNVYQSFLSRVAEGRRRKKAEVEPLAEGRVWMGAQAHANGLIDEIGGLDRAIELVKERAKIGKQEKVRLVMYPRKRSLFDLVFGRTEESLLDAKVRGLLGWPELKVFDWRLWSQGGMMRLMPYRVEVR